MSDIHALVGAYAVDALDDVERAAFERHLAECADCRAEVAGLREAAAVIGRDRRHRRPRPRCATACSPTSPPSGRCPPLDRHVAAPCGAARFRPRALVAAAAAVIAVGAGAAVVQPWDDDTRRRQLTAADQIRAASDAETFTQTLDGGARPP